MQKYIRNEDTTLQKAHTTLTATQAIHRRKARILLAELVKQTSLNNELAEPTVWNGEQLQRND